MKYNILDFNQCEVIKFNEQANEKIDLTDLLLLNYVGSALLIPEMEYAIIDNDVYVWLNHTKILEDLPILNIKENMLRKRFHKLSELGLIKCQTKPNESARGSKSYYAITDRTRLLYADSSRCKKLPLVERPDVKNYTSDINNSIINNTDIITNNSNNINNKSNINITTKSPKHNLYSDCIDIINDFTDNDSLRDCLVQYLNVLLEINRKNGKQLYKNVFKGKLNALNKIVQENQYTDKETEDVVMLSVTNGWQNFYPIKQYNSRLNNNISWQINNDTGGEILDEQY